MRRWFLSYHSPDLVTAERLEAALKRGDADAHVFFAPKNLRAGGYWLPTLAEEIAHATAFVLLVGEKGLGPWQILEYYEALDKRTKSPDFPLVVMLLEGQPAPGLPFLRQLHWIVTADPTSDESLARLVDAASGAGTRPGELWRYTSPYRGLAAMTEADSDFFFGRDRETVLVLNALAAAPHRLPVLLGNSGVGKSSLAQAGVLAALKRQAWPEHAGATDPWPHLFQDSRRWCFLKLSPGAAPLKALVEPFLDTWQLGATDPERVKQQNGWIELLRHGEGMLSDLLDATERRHAELQQPKPPAFLLYIDQGEELYVRAEPRQRERFSALLAQALSDRRLIALMSMRADFLGALQNDEPLYAVHRKIDVPPLREAELRDVVSRPAALLSARFETEGLSADIARRTAEESTKDAGALPLLSYLLDDMWTHMLERGDGVLRLPAQAMELGGVLADRANTFLVRHPDAEEALRRVLTLKLATVRENGEPTRRRARRSEFTDEEWRLISELADHPNRLLVTATPEDGEAYAEVAHEALFRRWEKLRQWIADQKEFLVWKSGLEAGRRLWEGAPEASKNDALLMGFPLAQAQSWLAQRAEVLSKPDREFIALSVGREVRDRKRRTRIRRMMIVGGALTLLLLTIVGFETVRYRAALVGAALEQQAAVAKQNYQLAVLSTQRVVDQVAASLDYGAISVKGARDVLARVNENLQQVTLAGHTLESAEAWVNLRLTFADIYAALGDLPQAYQTAKGAKEFTAPLADADPTNERFLRLLFAASWRIGDALVDQGNDPAIVLQALQEYKEAMRFTQQLVATTSDDNARKRERMFIHQKIGDTRQQQRNWDGAIEEYRAALGLIQFVIDEEPENADRQRDLANTLSRLGQALTNKRDFEAALKYFRDSYEIRRELVEKDRDNAALQSNLATSHYEFGRLYERRGDLDAAVTEYKTALEQRERFSRKDPDNAGWQVPLATLYTALAEVLRKKGDLTGALDQHTKAFRIRQQLAIRTPPIRSGGKAWQSL